MGYSYDMSNRLCCDNCGTSGGVRKRKCPHVVTTDSARGPRVAIHYCYPPALCNGCYRANGGLRGVHGQSCKDGAARSQAEYDVTEAKLAAGDLIVLAAWGDWQAKVPEGMCGVMFGKTGVAVYRLVPHDSYQPRAKGFLSDYPEATAWEDHA